MIQIVPLGETRIAECIEFILDQLSLPYSSYSALERKRDL